MRFNKNVFIHIFIMVAATAAIIIAGLWLNQWGYVTTFIFGGSVVSTVYELGSRGHTFTKKKFFFNITVLITSLILVISTLTPTTVAGLNIQPLLGSPTSAPNLVVETTLPNEAYGTFTFKVTVKNTGMATMEGVVVTPDFDNDIEMRDNSGNEIIPIPYSLGSIGRVSEKSVTYNCYSKTEGKQGISVTVSTTNAGVQTKIREITITKSSDSGDNGDPDPTEPAIEPEFPVYDNDAQEMFALMFSEVLSSTMTGITLVFIVLGTILIIMGDAQDSKDLYGIGAFAAAVPTALTIFSLLFGWAEPSAYFVNLAGAPMAGFAQGIVTLVVLMLLLNVAFMFDDVIGSALEK